MVVCECKYIRIQVHNSMVYFLNGIEISKQEKKTSLHWSKQWMISSNMNGKRTMKLFLIVYSRSMCIPMAISNGFRWTNLFADDAYVISYQLMYIYSELNMCDQRIYDCYTIIYTDKYIYRLYRIYTTVINKYMHTLGQRWHWRAWAFVIDFELWTHIIICWKQITHVFESLCKIYSISIIWTVSANCFD